MNRREVQKLRHGLYILHWKSGGNSIAAVGSMSDGQRWMAPTNWTSAMDGSPTAHGRVWKKVARAELVGFKGPR